MTKLIYKSIILLLPIIIVSIIVIIIDPYNYFPKISILGFNKKEQLLVDSHRNEAIYYGIWKTINFKRDPVDRIIIGDSRPNKIDTEQIYSLTGERYFNFAVPASNLDTACEIFWLSTRHVKLKKVYLGVGFQNYNSNEANQMYKEIERCTSNIYLYPLESRAVSSTIKIVKKLIDENSRTKEKITNKTVDIKSAKSGWDEIVYWLDSAYANYKYPDKYFKMLSDISNYCKINNIEFHIIIYPQHKVIRNLIQKHSLIGNYNKFISDMSRLGIVHNFDDNELYYDNSKLFSDPIHPNENFNKTIVSKVWHVN